MTTQPDLLMTDHHVPWSWGAGNDVWAMFAAAMGGDSDHLLTLLSRTPSLVRCECDYRTPLHFGVRENQVDAVRLLLERGAEVPYADGKGSIDRPVVMARDRGYREMEELLKEHQFASFQICEAGDRVAEAIRESDFSGSEPVIATHGIDVADARGNKALHWAVMTRRTDVIEFCLQEGADINAVRPDGARPLDLSNGDYYYRGWRDVHENGVTDHWAVMEFLLEQGAEYDLTTACRRGDRARVREILRDDPAAANRDAKYNTWYSGFPLRSAAKAGHLEIVRLLLEHGADPNKPEHGLAPFGGSVYDATQNGHYEVVRLLLENGASPNQDVESSGCPLSQADAALSELLRAHGARYDAFACCLHGHVEDFAWLCERDPFVANNSQLFAMAAESGLKQIVEIFLRYQPDMWQRMPARLGQSAEITAWMLASGMDPNQTNWLGFHRLHRGCSIEDLEAWVRMGADLNIIDGEHQSTPLGRAARSGAVDYAKALLQHGADRDLAGADWARPIEWAKRRGHEGMIRTLD